jgi:hypothetical protein
MNNRIRVKIIGNYRTHVWVRQFPGGRPGWGNCEFLLDPAAGEYDWLVVYNDFPSDHQEEKLPGRRERSLLVTTEPSTIKAYGRAYTEQFGYVLTSQEAWALPHRGRIFSQPALQWFYGLGGKNYRTYDEMAAAPPAKTRVFSTVCSTKRQRHTLHNRRYDFTQEVKGLIPDMEIFGHGVREMDDKAEALADYKYHLAIENFIGPHHWTEKLSDVFLAAALPFYAGCPNAADYFPAESFIPLDIYDAKGASEIIKRAIRDNEYEKRLPAILESRRLVLETYNLFAVLAREIEARHDTATSSSGGVILSRRLLRKRSAAIAVQDVYEKCRLKLLHAVHYGKS